MSTTTVDIRTKMDSKAQQAMEKMARATKQAAKAEEKYQDRLAKTAQQIRENKRMERDLVRMGVRPSKFRQFFGGVGGGAIGGAIGGPGGSFVGGMLGQSGGAAMAGVGVAVAAYQALTAAAGKAAQALEILNNGAMTAAQKQDQFAKMIPGGETWIKLRDAITGVTESLRKLNVDQQQALLAQSQVHEKEMRDAATRAEITGFENRGAALRGVKVPGTLNDLAGGRGTFAGQIAYEEAAARFGPQNALARAEAERNAARSNLGASNTRLGRMEGARTRLIDQMDKARAAERQAERNGNAFGADAGENRVERTKAGLEALKAEQAVLNNEAEIEAELNRQKELGVQLAQKESDIRKAQIGLQKAELQILQQKEARQAGAATALGMMSPAQQAMAMAGLNMMKNGNMPLGMMPPALRGLVQQVAPGFVNKMAETQGAGSEAFKQFQEAGAVDKGTLAETRKELAKVQTEVEVNINLDEQQLAEQIAKRLNTFLEKLIDTIDAKAKAEGERLRTGLQIRNANQ